MRLSKVFVGLGLIVCFSLVYSGIGLGGTISEGPAGWEKYVGKEWEPERYIWSLGTVDPNIKGTFRIMSWESTDEFTPYYIIFKRFFEKYYPNMNVEINWGVDWNTYWAKLPTMLAAGDIPDLVWMHDTRVKSYAARNMLMSLEEYIESHPPLGWPYDWYPSQIEAFQYQGKQFAVPYDFAPGGMFFNKDLFDKAGLAYPPQWSTDWTLEDMLAMAKKLTKDTDGDGKIDQYGVAFQTNAPQVIYWIVRSFGGGYFDSTTNEAILDDPATIRAFQFIADLIHKWKVHPTIGPQVQWYQLFANETVAMVFGLNDDAFGYNTAIGDKFQWGVAPSPRGPQRRAQFVGGSAFAIPKGAKYPDIAYEVTRYTLSNPEVQPLAGRIVSRYVARKSFHPFALTREMDEKLPNFHYVFSELGAQDGVVPWYHSGFGEFADKWSRYLDPLFITGKVDAKTALNKFQKEAQRILDEALR